MTRSGAARANGSLGFGELLLAGGLLLVLHNVGILDFRDAIRATAMAIRDLWPLLFVAWGAGLILEGLRRRRGRISVAPSVPEARS